MKSWFKKYTSSILISTVLVSIGAIVFLIVAHPSVHMKSGLALFLAILIHIVGISLELFIVATIVNFCTTKFKSKVNVIENTKLKADQASEFKP